MMQTRVPLVSIIMATHNGERYIREALASVFAQTLTDFELLVIDDASTDVVANKLDLLRDSRIRVVTNQQQRGLTHSLNRGIAAARGRYVARIDDDDIWPDEEKLSRQVAYLESHTAVGLVGVEINEVIDFTNHLLYRLQYPTTDEELRRQMLSRNQFVHSGVMIRRQALDRVGQYNEALRYAQDFELWLRIGVQYQVANIAGLRVRQRVTEYGITSRKNWQQYASFVRTAWRYRAVYPGFWRTAPHYGREALINVVPKSFFYRMSAGRRRFGEWRRTHGWPR